MFSHITKNITHHSNWVSLNLSSVRYFSIRVTVLVFGSGRFVELNAQMTGVATPAEYEHDM